MKILLKFNTKSAEQKIYLVSGDSWTNATVRKKLPSFMSHLKETEVSKDRHVIMEWSPGWKTLKSVQWFELKELSEATQSRIADLVQAGNSAGLKCAWKRENSVSSEEIQGYFKEIVGKPCTENGIPLCKLMLYRTAFALQFRNVGIKPYTSLDENDVGWVRMREGANIIDTSSVELAYEQLASAKKWYKRQYFEWDQETDSYQRDSQERSNPWETGLVHFRVHGFVDVEAANFCELLFTYVHETSHAWANTRDNTDKWGGGSMYLRRWVKDDRETVIQRAKKDSVLLLTSADFISYVILRKAGVIEPEFLDRKSWRD